MVIAYAGNKYNPVLLLHCITCNTVIQYLLHHTNSGLCPILVPVAVHEGDRPYHGRDGYYLGGDALHGGYLQNYGR